MTQLIDHGSVRRGLLGVTVQPVTPDIARSLGRSKRARRAGERRDAGRPGRQGRPPARRRHHRDQRRRREGHQQPAQRGRRRCCPARTSRSRSCATARSRRSTCASASCRPRAAERRGRRGARPIGLRLRALGRAADPRRGARSSACGDRAGWSSPASEPSSRAADAGLREGDVIEEVDGAKVTTADALRSALTKTATNAGAAARPPRRGDGLRDPRPQPSRTSSARTAAAPPAVRRVLAAPHLRFVRRLPAPQASCRDPPSR